MAIVSEEALFKKFLNLIGHLVEVGVDSAGRIFKGKVVYTMPDSFILEVNGTKKVITFKDIVFINENKET